MPRKHKTRKQREKTPKAIINQVEPIHQHSQPTTYTISVPQASNLNSRTSKSVSSSDFEKADAAYLRHDMVSIAKATGVIVAFNLILFTLLSTGVIKLNFLGY
jgi:hypothetical protein